MTSFRDLADTLRAVETELKSKTKKITARVHCKAKKGSDVAAVFLSSFVLMNTKTKTQRPNKNFKSINLKSGYASMYFLSNFWPVFSVRATRTDLVELATNR